MKEKELVDLTDEELSIVKILQNGNDAHVDIFYQNLELSPSKLASALLQLEFNGVIKASPGKRYSLIK